MTKRSVLIIFTLINIVFIAAQVYKHARINNLNYTHSTLIAETHTLDHAVESLRQQLCVHKDVGHIKKYAQETLHMKPLALNRVKRLAL